MLMEFDQLEGLLKSPVSGGSLAFNEDRSTMSAVDAQDEFPVVDGIPMLVDFEHSVLEAEHVDFQGVGSPIERPKYGGAGAFLKKIVNKSSAVTNRNVKAMREHLSGIQSPVVLLVGGGTVGEGMGFLLEDKNIKLISFDIYGTDITQFVADAHSIPLVDDCVDCVIVQAVLEHVMSPQVVVDEIHRVLNSGGVVYAETPFMQQVHEGAFDFTRYTDSGHRQLFARFELIGSGAVTGPGTALLWSIDYFFRSLFRSRAAGKFAKLMFFWLQYLDVFIPDGYSIDAASAVYFYGRKTSDSISPKEVIAHYKGAQ